MPKKQTAVKAEASLEKPTDETAGEIAAVDDSMLPKKALFRIDEVAAYFDIARSTVYLWIDHGILTAEKYGSTTRVPRESILKCRLANRLKPLE